MQLNPLDTRDVYPSRRPRIVDGQSILHLDVPSHPTTKAPAANAAGPEVHTTAETKLWGRQTCLSTRYHRRDFEGRSSNLATVAAFSHVFRNSGLADIDPELEQFAVNPWRSPQGVGSAHLENELANVRGGPWPAAAPS